MTTSADIRRILERACDDGAFLDNAIARVQTWAWMAPREELQLSDVEHARLKDLAYDLEFFVRNPEWRAEDPSYFGPEEAVARIKEALPVFGPSGGGLEKA